MITNYKVKGMTCAHCVAHVTEEVSAIAGVAKVEVQLPSSMSIESDAPIDFAKVVEAVDEAGNYTVELA